MNVIFSGLEQFQKRLSQVANKTTQAMYLSMRAYTKKMEAEMKKSINIRNSTTGSRGGKIYFPSEVGEPPHKRTGELFVNVYSKAQKTGSYKVEGSVGANKEYAAYLELGTSKMSPRPFIRPVVEENKDLYNDLLKEAMERI